MKLKSDEKAAELVLDCGGYERIIPAHEKYEIEPKYR